MNRILQLFKRPELRNKVFFILGILVVSRVISNIPLPVLDAARLQEFFANNQLLGLLSAFTGGSLERLSIGLLGLGPYITASIIMQLMTMIFPSLEQMYKYEGEAGRTRFNQYSRMLTVPLAALQGYSFIKLLMQQGLVSALSPMDWLLSLSVIIASSVFLMWLGELITEKNLGNGVSLLILAGIVSALPSHIQQAAFTYTPDQIFTYIALVLVGLAVIVGVVYITEAQRNIPITYARRIRGSKMYGGVSTYLPMRVNNAGVIPIIFALSILLFPGIIASILSGTSIPYVSDIATAVNNFVQSQLWYAVLYFLLVVVFTYFYTAITFDPKSISDNIQKQGGYIPGIRPGPMTAAFLNNLLNKVTLVGALFLGLIAIMPNVVQGLTGITAFTLGGTSVLIVVSVALEIMKQVNAQLSMYEY
jgi:preprotein translocase subunit SecY